MYKLLLCWRYLRTRYIALASIISVTLGVATLIVVNSVMHGFTQEMHKRLNGVLADIVFEGAGLGGFPDPDWHQAEIRKVVGDDLAGMTTTVHVPAMLNFKFQGQWITRQVNLIGIDEQTYAQVSDFSQFLCHPENREKLSFMLREKGYDDRLPPSGWEHRRIRVEYERAYQEQLEAAGYAPGGERPPSIGQPNGAVQPTPLVGAETTESPAKLENFAPEEPSAPPGDETAARPLTTAASDPFRRREENEEIEVFDESKEQHTGVVLGFAIATMRGRDPMTEKVTDFFLSRPGDDVLLTFPNAAQPPGAVTEKCTVVDFYESKMSEYDSSFAFIPIRRLQELRGMIDPLTGVASATSIQLRLKAGADLEAVQSRLFDRFPQDQYTYRIRTWKDMQGPLLHAVQMETTILNILLFMIIAVAGFGILATFFMIVVEKTRDVGILKALGAPSGGVMTIFLSYGLLLGIVGSGVGTVLGLMFVVNINTIADCLEYVTNRPVFDPTIYYFQEIPTIINAWTISWICAGSILIAVMASVLPALRAARLHPVEALRYE